MNRTLLAATILSLPILAQAPGAVAQPIQGLYIGAGGGGNFLSDERLRTTTFGGITSTVPKSANRLSYSTGYVGLGSIGWGFGNGVRLEVEGSYRSNDVNKGAFFLGLKPSGQEEKYGAMGNVLFDLDIGSPYVFPYLGAGAGWQWAHQQSTVSSTTPSFLPGIAPAMFTRHLGGTQGSFAYQAIAGAAFPIPGVVGLSATAEYRYLGMAADRKYTGYSSSSFGAFGSTVKIGQRVTENNNHSLLVGLRYAFSVEPPVIAAAVPVAAPATARSYLVFFDWDKSDLSARARQIIAEAAQASTSNATTRIEVDGHADKSGTAAYNQALSRRRADTVAAELVRDGVPRGAITVVAFGDTRPLVPTAAGVREAQNRRVEIILR